MKSVFHDAEWKIGSQVELAEWNAASPPAAAAFARRCLDIPRWVDGLVDARPYPDVDALSRACVDTAAPFTDDELERALQSHPRIGDAVDGDGSDAAHARAEQSDVDIEDPAVEQRLRRANVRYERQFGRVFLIRAAGRGVDDVLAALETRLRHDPVTERGVVEHELREIATLRATGALPR